MGNSSAPEVQAHRGELVGKRAVPLPNLLSAQPVHPPTAPAEVGETETSKTVCGLQVNNWFANGELS